MVDWLAGLISHLLLLVGLSFFVAGTAGVLRFPDVFSRLHAVTKADTVGLGFIVFGLSISSGSVRSSVLMLVIWVLVMISGAVSCQLYARFERERHGARERGP